MVTPLWARSSASREAYLSSRSLSRSDTTCMPSKSRCSSFAREEICASSPSRIIFAAESFRICAAACKTRSSSDSGNTIVRGAAFARSVNLPWKARGGIAGRGAFFKVGANLARSSALTSLPLNAITGACSRETEGVKLALTKIVATGVPPAWEALNAMMCPD